MLLISLLSVHIKRFYKTIKKEELPRSLEIPHNLFENHQLVPGNFLQLVNANKKL